MYTSYLPWEYHGNTVLVVYLYTIPVLVAYLTSSELREQPGRCIAHGIRVLRLKPVALSNVCSRSSLSAVTYNSIIMTNDAVVMSVDKLE